MTEAQKRASDKYEKSRSGRMVAIRLSTDEIKLIDAHRGVLSRAEFVRRKLKLGRLAARK
tara:strand:- start:659 stop:838 length:180 start_codon:yes stop_codon:yes gene_type:complete